MKPLGVSKYVRWLAISGFVITLVLLAAASYSMLTSTGDLLSYLLFPCLIPIAFLLLFIILYTQGVFQYSERLRNKEVAHFINWIWGQPLTRRDFSPIKQQVARQWHPDNKREDYQTFCNDVLSRINNYINDLETEVRRDGSINWERRQDDVSKFAR